jgi:GT2 family glycosyltransferase
MKNASGNVLVSIINWNNSAATHECLASIANIPIAKQPDVLVIDNHSTREHFELSASIQKSLRSITSMRNTHNDGFAGGHNKAIQYALKHNYDYICLLNNDTVLKDAALFSKLIEALKVTGAAGAAPTIIESEDPARIWFGGGTLQSKNAKTSHNNYGLTLQAVAPLEPITTCTFLTGCCLMISLKELKSDALMDDSYFLYWEDADWCKKTRQAGHTLVYVKDALLLHKTSSSLGVRSPKYAYYNVRNRIRFAKKWHSFMPYVYASTVVTACKIVLLSAKKPRTFFATIHMVTLALLHGITNKGGALK